MVRDLTYEDSLFHQVNVYLQFQLFLWLNRLIAEKYRRFFNKNTKNFHELDEELWLFEINQRFVQVLLNLLRNDVCFQLMYLSTIEIFSTTVELLSKNEFFSDDLKKMIMMIWEDENVLPEASSMFSSEIFIINLCLLFSMYCFPDGESLKYDKMTSLFSFWENEMLHNEWIRWFLCWWIISSFWTCDNHQIIEEKYSSIFFQTRCWLNSHHIIRNIISFIIN